MKKRQRKQRSYAAVKFLLYNLAGGLIMLAAVVGLFVVTSDQLGEGTFSLQQIAEARADGGFNRTRASSGCSSSASSSPSR